MMSENLRRTIRKIILESTFEKMEFEQMWHDPDSGIPRKNWPSGKMRSTHHRDSFNKNMSNSARRSWDAVGTHEEYFADRRELKRMWNRAVDDGGHRDFWENSGKVQFFHSLEYYGDSGADTLVTGAKSDGDISDLSMKAFFEKYKPRHNRDEMSTWGVYKGKSKATEGKHSYGFLLKGRCTYASFEDLYTESRSKVTPEDMNTHRGSGLPKRPGISKFVTEDSVIGERDIISDGRPLGECVLDNWSIDALVISKLSTRWMAIKNDPKIMQLIKYYGIRILHPDEVFTGGRR
jgi:hypothetical protein